MKSGHINWTESVRVRAMTLSEPLEEELSAQCGREALWQHNRI